MKLEFAVVLLLLVPARGRAAAPDRSSTVALQKVELERQMGQALNQSLSILVGAGRGHAAVAVTMSAAIIAEPRARADSPAVSFTMAKVSSETSLKLPGLPNLGTGMGKLHQPVKIRVEPNDRRQAAGQHIEAFVEKIAVHLFLDAEVPPALVNAARTAVARLAGVDPDRGDSITLTRFSQATPASPQSPWVKVIYAALVIVPLSFIVATALLALGLGRRARPAHGERGLEVALTQTGQQGGEAASGDEAPETEEGAQDGTNGHARAAWLLACLEDAAPDHLVTIIQGLDDREAAAAIALAPLEPTAIAALLGRLGPERQAGIGARLAQGVKLSRGELDGLKVTVEELLEAARNPSEIEVGGPERLSTILAGSSRSAVRLVLDRLLAIDPELARRARGGLKQFEDLPSLPVEVRRKLVATIDPAVLARALHGAEAAVSEAIDQVLSRRQSRILAEERSGLGTLTEESVEEARERIQHSLNSSLSS